MSSPIRISKSASVTGGGSFNGSVTDSASLIQNLPVFLAPGTNVSFSIAFTISALSSVFIVADQAVTIKVNSSGSPTATINLVPGVPLDWSAAAAYYTQPFGSSNVTAFFFTNTAAANIKGYVATA